MPLRCTDLGFFFVLIQFPLFQIQMIEISIFSVWDIFEILILLHQIHCKAAIVRIITLE